jgi:hypothetical protein
MTNERIKTLEERAQRGLNKVESILEKSEKNNWKITWNDWKVLAPFFIAFLGEPPFNEGETYKRGKGLLERTLQAGALSLFTLDEEEDPGRKRRKSRKSSDREEDTESSRVFAEDFRKFHEKILMDKNLLEASLAYCSLYFRSIQGDEKSLNKSLEILGEDRMEDALDIYNQGMNFKEISEPKDAEGMKNFVTINIVYKLQAISKYNAFLSRLTEREELKDFNYLSCFYFDTRNLSTDLYTEGLENLKKEIKYNKNEKLLTLDRIFPELTEEKAIFKTGEEILFSSDEESLKGRSKYLEVELKAETEKTFQLYATCLY